ncbi:hypothetical protein F5Y18DRAFT_304992 [Xylariaceae sp. FL1019]|nr:hypothetical protein F5Y18DRAFT_304992 [Xylariaceae sp. FL1019]
MWPILSILCLTLLFPPSEAQALDEPLFTCPLPKCPCPSTSRRTAPVVGLALEIGYGTASIKYNNGTIQPVSKINGSPQYINLMKHYATSPINGMSDGSRTPPGVDERDISTRNTFFLYKTKCYIRKLLFLPSTPEIGILADMVSQLRREVEATLGHRVKGVAISSPDRVRLTVYEIRDILDCLWMEDLVSERKKTVFNQLFALPAATAAYGDGLCNSYTDAYQCAREEYYFPRRWTLQLDFSRHGLSAAMEAMGTARSGWARADFVDLNLGEDDRPREDALAEDEFWRGVQTRIRHFVEANHRPEKLYLTGESAAELRFLEAVRNALGDLVSPPVLEVLNGAATTTNQGFTFTTSMGAAEFAKRRQEGMARCQLPDECSGKAAPKESRPGGEL